MKFDDFFRKGLVKRVKPDVNLAKSLLENSEEDLSFFENLEINEKSARKIMSNYYDILREVLEALALIDGYKIYSHESFKYFLLEKNEKRISEKFDRFRKIRNKLNYYGKSISKEETKKNIVEIKKIINELKQKYLKI